MFSLRRSLHSIGLFSALAFAAPGARAEPVSDQVLSGASVTEKNGCALVRIGFHQRVQFLSQFAATGGDELHVQINLIDRGAGDRRPLGAREGLRAPQSDLAGIFAIELEAKGNTDALILYFKRNVVTRVAQGGDFRSLIVLVADPENAMKCQSQLEAAAAITTPQDMLAPVGKPAKAAKAGGKSGDDADKLWSEARTAYDEKRYDRAVQLLTSLIEAGGSRYQEDAQELLALAREQRGQIAHARAEYKEYLRLYPNGAGADRVRQRLAALDASGKPGEGTAGGLAKADGAAAGPRIVLDDKGQPLVGTPSTGNGTHLAQLEPPPEWNFSGFGSASVFYNLNQGGRGFIQTPRTNVGWDKEDPYRTYQNTVLGNFDYDARFDNAGYAGRMRFSASEQYDFQGITPTETRVSTLYFDARVKDTGTTARIGRQTSTTGGVLGRFDGIGAGVRVADGWTVNGIAGSPVERASNLPFASDDYFFGLSTDVSWFGKSLDTTLYAIEQRKEDFVDRRGLGLEARHAKNGLAVYGAAEYDVHFAELNSALVTASSIFDDRSALSITADYRRSPVLLASNALQGQGLFRLSDLLQRYSTTEVDHLALDRTARSVVSTVSYSRPLADWLQWNNDFTVSWLSGMPASGGLDAVVSPGTDYFASSQLMASGLLREGDTVSGALRYANSSTSDRYLVELGVSYPVSPVWRLHPMLQLGYMSYKNQQREDYQLLPTIRSFYKIFDDTTFEMELGGKIIESDSADSGKQLQSELLVLAGVRYDFTNRSSFGTPGAPFGPLSDKGRLQLGRFDFGASLGRMWGVANEHAYYQDGSQLSKLTWRYDNDTFVGGSAAWRPLDWLSVGVAGRTNMSGKSVMNDYDYGISGCPGEICHSYHDDTLLTRMYVLDVHGAATLPVTSAISVGAIGGYRKESSKWQARGGIANYGMLPSGLAIEYEQNWSAPYAGVEAKVVYDRFSVAGKLIGSLWAHGHDADNHHWTSTLYEDAFGQSSMFEASATVAYQLAESWSVQAEYEYRRWRTAKGPTTTTYYQMGFAVETGGDVAGADNTVQSISLGINKTF